MKYYTEETISEMSREIKFRGRTVNGYTAHHIQIRYIDKVALVLIYG